MKDYKVCILTTFYDVDPAYSLCNCVEDQIRMFVENGYSIKLLVDKEFKAPGGYWSHPNVKIGYTPRVQRDNEGQLNENWREEVAAMKASLAEELKDCKVVITHDIVLQPAHLIWNYASRLVAEEREDLRWLHWSHSPTSPQILCNQDEISEKIRTKFPNALYCYPNDWDRLRVAQNYGVELDEVRCVHHPSDFASLLFGDGIELKYYDMRDSARQEIEKKINYPIKLSKAIVKDFDLWNADIIAAYPCRLDRGKQPEFLIKTMAMMKKKGRSVRCIIFDFHSTGGDKVVYREELKQMGVEWGLELQKDLIFISEWREDTRYNVPRETIMNIKKISDFHMHSSNTETYSLVVQESMATKNFCILNNHTPMMRDIYGSKNVLYEGFGASVNMMTGENGSTILDIHNEDEYFTVLAGKILYFVENNPVLNQWQFIRKHRNMDYIFRKELEPLLYAGNLNSDTQIQR